MTAAVVHQRPTRRQLEVLRAYIAAGSIAAPAQELGYQQGLNWPPARVTFGSGRAA